MSGVGVPLTVPLSAEDLQRLCDFIYRRTGIFYGESKRYYIERRLAQGMERSGTHSFQAYMALLRASPPEAEQLINSITVNETYFFREEHQLRCLGRSLLPEIVSRRGPGDLVRLWSMPCSTGEEPYSIAIWLLENWPLVDAYNIEIVGSDLDTAVLAAAAEGLYGERALSRLPADLLGRYFEAPHGRQRRIIQDLRESVRFTTANLVDAASMATQGQFDVVFCRNVLIYFDDDSRLAASRNLFNSLNPGGFLCLGHSESMARISDRFTARRFEDAIVYQRPAAI
ncbi:CheR family methyltransferase [Roseomonas xinghualingensis]|uniref:CheR family methyltransferase n=1 Tax=Roseomonas xinghualingensis TaxID=2986475 RepID=UPI0021F14842|nr:protein-glutamate O-methyltransferase CheR [Roseomonas sp. SXEYE001]MCV4206335.1 protein-glutamate O-methyltransferase CheR [Roseomonas sp. SXEYE001]